MVNIRQFERKLAVVNSLINDVMNALPDSELPEELRNNFDELYSMSLDSIEMIDVILSGAEK